LHGGCGMAAKRPSAAGPQPKAFETQRR
jgi:hypothetical protein